MSILTNLTIDEENKIIEAMKKIDENGISIAIVTDKDEKVSGMISDGDIRKAILRGIDVREQKIKEIMRTDPIFLYEHDLNNHGIVNKTLSTLIQRSPLTKFIPVLDNEKRLKNLFVCSELRKGNKVNFDIWSKSHIKDVRSVKKVLIVGGAGYLGSILARKLLDRGYKIRILDLFLFGEEALHEIKNNPNLEIIKGDVRNIETISSALMGIDAVIHLAAIVGDPACKSQPIDTIETNYLATKILADSCKYHQINRFIFASTCSVYGAGEGGLRDLTEEFPLKPISLYAKSKIKSEEGILNLVDDNFSPCILRMATLYGLSPRMRFDLVVNVFAMKALTEKKVTIFGGEQWRPLLHVDDAAEAYIKCLEAPIEKIKGEIFNVGSDSENYQINHLADITKEVVPETHIEKTEREIVQGQVDKRNYKVSFEKIKKMLNFTTKKTVKDGIAEIKEAIENGKFKNVKDKKYYNILEE